MIKPLGTRVLLKREAEKEQTESGIFIPKGAVDVEAVAEVLATGDDVRSTVLNAGVKVLYKEYSVTDVSIDGEDFLLINEDDILAVLKK